MSPQTGSDFRETNRVFEEEVIAKGDYGALDRVYTHDARVLPPSAEMLIGRENAKAFWQQAVAGLGVKSIALRTVEMEELGDTAVEIGRATITTEGGGMDVKYVVVWKREDGTWKWHIDIWNPAS